MLACFASSIKKNAFALYTGGDNTEKPEAHAYVEWGAKEISAESESRWTRKGLKV